MWKTWLVVLLVIFAAAMCSGVVWIIELPVVLASGWIPYLSRTIPQVTWNWPAIASGCALLVLSIGGFHLLARSIATSHQNVWRWGWSIRISILFFVIFGVSIAFGGIAHQVGWLASTERWLGSSGGRITKEIANARQLIVALRLHAADEGGRYPAQLDGLLTAGSLEGLENFEKMSIYIGDSTSPPAPWIYVRGLSDSAPENVPIIVAPYTYKGGKRIIGTNDTTVELMKPSQIRSLIPTWKQEYDALGIPLPTVLREYETLATQQ